MGRRTAGGVVVVAALTATIIGCDVEQGKRQGPRGGGAPSGASTGSATTAVRDETMRVVVDSATTLAGTFVYPARALTAPVGAVLLLSGSGPQNRDGARAELPGYAPWRELSDAIVASGLAVLRLDDRGTGQSTGRFAGATTEDFARDADAALAWLRAHRAVNVSRLALVGHSEGAVVALLVARAHPSLAAVVLWGAPSRPGREIARWQRQQLVTGNLARWSVEERAAVLATADAQADSLARHDPWLRTWFALDPRIIAGGVRAPVLLLHGETDQQVPPAQANELAQVLRGAGATPVDVRLFRDTDHLLLADYDGDPQGYERLAERRVRSSVLAATTHFLSVHMTAH